MLNAETTINFLNSVEVDFFCGVPDSLLKEFCSVCQENLSATNHITTSNEGAAIGLGIGHHLATGKIPLIYLQNSGLGNIINPLISLSSPQVYGIPMLLLVGWRGEPNVKDEPQHVHQGSAMLDMILSMGFSYIILSKDENEAHQQLNSCKETALKENKPVFIIVRKNTFSNKAASKSALESPLITREEAIETVVNLADPKAIFVSTTGMASRELFEIRVRNNQSHDRDFLTVGGMGHANQIALGIALSKPAQPIYCIDGDGAAIMHMGSMTTIGQINPSHYFHIILNNGAHDSVGGQPTTGKQISFTEIAGACGYEYIDSVNSISGIKDFLNKYGQSSGSKFLEINIKKGNREDLGRPSTSPIENKNGLMNYIFESLE